MLEEQDKEEQMEEFVEKLKGTYRPMADRVRDYFVWELENQDDDYALGFESGTIAWVPAFGDFCLFGEDGFTIGKAANLLNDIEDDELLETFENVFEIEDLEAWEEE